MTPPEEDLSGEDPLAVLGGRPAGRGGAEDRGCEFALCRRPREVEVIVAPNQTMQVCGLHVTPVLVWGRPFPLDGSRVRALRDAS